MAEILFCKECHKYTLEKKCKCGKATVNTKPAKWNPEDKYAEYRLRYKEKNAKH